MKARPQEFANIEIVLGIIYEEVRIYGVEDGLHFVRSDGVEDLCLRLREEEESQKH